MLSIILLAMIGTGINLGPAYWVLYGIYCVFRILKIFIDITRIGNYDEKLKKLERDIEKLK